MTRSSSPPARVAHLGLGAFHRSHQAWYTHAANELVPAGERWGITAFTGRSPAAAQVLAAQGCRYTLLVRGAERDEAVSVASIVAAHDGADAAAWRSVLAAPATAVVTLTVTEAGYHLTAAGHLDVDGPVLADAERLAADPAAAALTMPGRLVAGLHARRAAGAGPLAVVSCDNLPGNGAATRAGVVELADQVDAGLAGWITEHVAFVSTVVDRITPATTPADRAAARELAGWDDHAPVVAEPYTEWVLSGEFPAGRPPWELAGARFAGDLVPYERRKLWLLNAGHSLLAYAGLLAEHATVAQAFADPGCRRAVEELWAEAVAVLPLPAGDLETFLAALRVRWANARIEHRLSQIAADGFHKLGVRVLPVAAARARAGLPVGDAGALAVAAWIRRLTGPDGAAGDPGAAALAGLAGRPAPDQARLAVGALDPGLPDADLFAAAVARHLATTHGPTPTP